MKELCPVCSLTVDWGEGIRCYLCGRLFHLSSARECGHVLPNPKACCGLIHLCRPCATGVAVQAPS